MTDIVERLRASRPSNKGVVLVHEVVVQKAVAEIERLRRLIGDMLQAQHKQERVYTVQYNQIERQRLEIERLRDQGGSTMTEPLLQFFAYEHLPTHLQDVSQPFGILALQIVDTLPRNPERTVCLRKLLEAKDCAVRAVLYKDVP